MTNTPADGPDHVQAPSVAARINGELMAVAPSQTWSLPVPIETARAKLRWHSPDDVDDLLRFHSDPEVTRYLPWPVRDREAVIATLQTKIAQTHLDADGTWLSLAVEDVRSRRVVGEALLSRTSHATATAEIGYALARDVHGRGFGSEIVGALLKAAWAHLPVQQVWAHVDVDNHASRRLLEKLDFRRSGHKNNDAESLLLRYVLVRAASS